MIRVLTILAFFLSPIFLHGQENYLDSLYRTVLSGNQTKKFNGYISLSNFYTEKSLDSSLHYAEAAIDFAVKGKKNEQIAQAYRNLGLLALKHVDFDTSKKNIALSKTYYALDKDTLAIALIDFELGKIYYQQANLSEALSKFLKAHDFFMTLKPSVKLLDIKRYIAKIYDDLEMIDKSREFQTETLRLSEVLNSSEGVMTSKNRIALLFAKENRFVEAVKYFEEAISIGMHDPELMDELLVAFNGLANVHYSTGKYELSLFCSNKVLEILDVEKKPDMAAHVYHTMGMSYLELREFVKSKNYLQKAYANLSNNPSNAPVLAACNEGLYHLYEKMGNYKMALHHYKISSNMKDSIYGKKINEKILQLESERELTIKDREYERLRLEAENQKLRLQSKIKNTIIVCAIILAIALFLFTTSRFKNRSLKTEKELLLAKNKLDSLRSQMNPHFVFNVINGVQNFILKSEKYEAYEHLNKFANSIRLIVNNSADAFISLEDELKLINNYIELEKVRFRNSFNFSVKVPQELLNKNPKIPSMIIQPVVENAIIHGLSNKEGEGLLMVDFQYKQDEYNFILCTIEDNGIGREKALEIKKRNNHGENHLSISTTNTHQRIDILKKMGYHGAEMRILDLFDDRQKPIGTKVVLSLPIMAT